MFKINGEIWYIKFVDPDDYMLMRSDGSISIGACDDPTKTIYINKYLRGDFLKKVLCHEITHSAMFSYNVEMSVQQEEILADLIATYGKEIISTTDRIFRKLKER